jgi:hypothetical protein
MDLRAAGYEFVDWISTGSEYKCNEYIYRCEISGFGRSVVEAFALL